MFQETKGRFYPYPTGVDYETGVGSVPFWYVHVAGGCGIADLMEMETEAELSEDWFTEVGKAGDDGLPDILFRRQ